MHQVLPTEHTSKQVKSVLTWILVFNVIVLLVKAWIGVVSGSLSIIGDAVHSGVDSLNNIIGIFMIRIAAMPADEDHPYGHSKFETLGALVVVAFLAIASYELIEKSIIRFFNPGELPNISQLTIYLLATTLLINIIVWLYEKYKGEELNSELLLADAEHTFSDILITVSILASVVFIKQGMYILDPILGFVIAGIILKSGISILRRTVPILVDEAWISSLELQKIIDAFPAAKSFSDLRSRRSHNSKYAEFSVQFATDSLQEAHDLAHEIEERIKAEHGEAELVIHIEPV